MLPRSNLRVMIAAPSEFLLTLDLDWLLQLARCFIAGAIGFALLWYDWKRDEKQFRRIVREEIEQALGRSARIIRDHGRPDSGGVTVLLDKPEEVSEVK